MDIKKLIAVATGEIAHTNNGLCPDMGDGYDSRDPDCLACRIIIEAEREAPNPSEHPADCPILNIADSYAKTAWLDGRDRLKTSPLRDLMRRQLESTIRDALQAGAAAAAEFASTIKDLRQRVAELEAERAERGDDQPSKAGG